MGNNVGQQSKAAGRLQTRGLETIHQHPTGRRFGDRTHGAGCVLGLHLRSIARPAAAADGDHRSQPRAIPCCWCGFRTTSTRSAWRCGTCWTARTRYPLTAWRSQFQRIRMDLDDAVAREASVAPASRTAEQRELSALLDGAVLGRARSHLRAWRRGTRREARAEIRLSLQARQAALSTAVSRHLVQNNESEEQAVARTQQIHAQVERQCLCVSCRDARCCLAAVSVYLVNYNRRRVRARFGALGAAQRTGAATDHDAGEHVPIDLARTARRLRTDPDGGGSHAAAFRAAGRDLIPRRFARNCGRCSRSCSRRSIRSARYRRRCIR